MLLGLTIEKISGMSYHDYVRQHIFAPAGMTQSDFLRMDRVHENVAEGCDPIHDKNGQIRGWKKNIYSYPPIGSPDGGAYVTAGDLDRFLRAVQRGQLVSLELTAAFFTPQAQWQSNEEWKRFFGYGLKFYFDADERLVCYQKEGINVGTSGVIRHFPKDDINLVILSNMEDGAWKPLWEIHKLIVEGKFAEKTDLEFQLPGSTFELLQTGAAEWLRMQVASGPMIRTKKRRNCSFSTHRAQNLNCTKLCLCTPRWQAVWPVEVRSTHPRPLRDRSHWLSSVVC